FKNPEEAMISWVGTIYHDKNDVRKVLYTLSDVGADMWNGYEIKRYQNQTQLLKGLAHDIREYDPLTLSAYNNKFDFINLNEERTFEIGINKNTPVHEATTKFFERIATTGRLLVDRLRWAQIAYQYLPNKKLNLIGKEVLGTQGFDKSITYAQMEKLERIALFDDDPKKRCEAAQTIATYTTEDVDVLIDIHNSQEFRWSLDFAARMADKNNLPLELLLYSPRALQKRQELDFFKKNKIYRNEFLKKKGARKEYSQAKQRFREYLSSLTELHTQPGVYNDVKLIQVNYAKALKKELFNIYPNAKHLLDMKPETPFQQEFITNFLNSSCDWIIADYMTIKKREEKILKRKNKIGISGGTEYKYQDIIKQQNDSHFRKETIEQAMMLAQQDGRNPDSEEVKDLLKEMYWHKRHKGRFYAQYKTNANTIERKLRELNTTIKHRLNVYGLERIHQEGPYIYVKGDNKNFEKEYPARVITTFDKVYVSEDFEENEHKNVKEGKRKLYYKRYGFYKGVKIKGDEPTHNLTLHEIKTYKGFLDNVFAERYEDAVSHIARQQLKVDLEQIANDNLVMMTKKKQQGDRDRYKAFEDSDIIYFYEDAANKDEFPIDEHTGRPYETMSIHMKERPIYIMNKQELRPDWHFYEQRHKRIIYNLAFHTIGKDNFLDVLQETWKQTLFREQAVRKAADKLRAHEY
ncbi:MAG: hypothetical protein ACQESE_04275, partial [Nanobdellota archaeon]